MDARLAICAVVKDEARYIEEWIAFHVLQGVRAFLIFDNGSRDGAREILHRLSDRVAITVVDWPNDDYDEMQLSAYDEGARRLSGAADWAAFIDVDEFIFGAEGRLLPAELAAFAPEVSAVAVGHRVFGSSGLATWSDELVTRRFTRCSAPENAQSRWFKTIARPDRVSDFDSAHSVRLREGVYVMADGRALGRADLGWHPGYADRVGHGAIALHHYMVKSREEFAWKQRRFDGKGMEYRYTDAFFAEHDALGDEVDNLALVTFSQPVRDLISAWR